MLNTYLDWLWDTMIKTTKYTDVNIKVINGKYVIENALADGVYQDAVNFCEIAKNRFNLDITIEKDPYAID